MVVHVSCRGNALCQHWLSALSNWKSAHQSASLDWNMLDQMSPELPQLALSSSGSLVALPSTNLQPRLPHANQLSLIDITSTAVEDANVLAKLEQWRKGGPEMWKKDAPRWLLHVTSHAAVLPAGIALASAPLMALDLSGGCCRGNGKPPPHGGYNRVPAPIQTLPWLSKQNPSLSANALWAIQNDMRLLAADVLKPDSAGEFEWLYLCVHSHGSTYYHGLAEAVPRVMWGLRLLRAHPQIKVLTSASTVIQMLELLGLGGRGVRPTKDRAYFARKLTIPPVVVVPSTSNKLAGTLRDLLFATSREVATRLPRPPPREERAHFPASREGLPYVVGGFIVVRRSAIGRKNARSMLNHDELVDVLRRILGVGKNGAGPLVEYPPDATVAQAAAIWGRAKVAIAPHGAGTTNIVFMPPNSTVIEIFASNQKGRVYGTLARLMGHRYVGCEFDRANPAFQPQLTWAHGWGYDSNFVLPVAWFLRCIRKGLNNTRGTPGSPWGDDTWRMIDVLVDYNASTVPVWATPKMPKQQKNKKDKKKANRRLENDQHTMLRQSSRPGVIRVPA